MPAECRHLHYLLATPFRYGAPYPRGSRFRRAGMTEGVFYASESASDGGRRDWRSTGCSSSPNCRKRHGRANPAEFTAFSVAVSTPRAIDLTADPYAGHQARWTDVTDYAPCQALADAARAADVDVIRSRSVRDPAGGINLALLRCRAFARPAPLAQQSWRIFLSASGAQARCEAPKAALTFGRDAFAADPRVAGMTWSR